MPAIERSGLNRRQVGSYGIKTGLLEARDLTGPYQALDLRIVFLAPEATLTGFRPFCNSIYTLCS